MTSSKRLVRGRVFELHRVTLGLPDGRRVEREVVRHPGAVAIVPLLPGGGVLLIRQFRFAVERTLLEIPAGTLEPGETAMAAARRELCEEAGVDARRLVKLATFFPSPGFCDERIHLFAATGLTPARTRPDEDECIIPVRMEAPQVREWIRRGRIRDAKTLIGLWLTGFHRTRRTARA